MYWRRVLSIRVCRLVDSRGTRFWRNQRAPEYGVWGFAGRQRICQDLMVTLDPPNWGHAGTLVAATMERFLYQTLTYEDTINYAIATALTSCRGCRLTDIPYEIHGPLPLHGLHGLQLEDVRSIFILVASQVPGPIIGLLFHPVPKQFVRARRHHAPSASESRFAYRARSSQGARSLATSGASGPWLRECI